MEIGLEDFAIGTTRATRRREEVNDVVLNDETRDAVNAHDGDHERHQEKEDTMPGDELAELEERRRHRMVDAPVFVLVVVFLAIHVERYIRLIPCQNHQIITSFPFLLAATVTGKSVICTDLRLSYHCQRSVVTRISLAD